MTNVIQNESFYESTYQLDNTRISYTRIVCISFEALIRMCVFFLFTVLGESSFSFYEYELHVRIQYNVRV